ncbi:hypothetical protein LOK49_LG13G00316 [Camellia lanceoleosa]|uniref:Uncharacterized protein n=1 Tax=Camellia lanceoleosa TaxID=1840588 RepID=A0ACC0FHE0_9ERIC|nr:hypothetical protein LOK49_LG13G00316 [Camellia lanceoleosa]
MSHHYSYLCTDITTLLVHGCFGSSSIRSSWKASRKRDASSNSWAKCVTANSRESSATSSAEHTKGGWGSGFIPIAKYGTEFHKGSRKGKSGKVVRLVYSGLALGLHYSMVSVLMCCSRVELGFDIRLSSLDLLIVIVSLLPGSGVELGFEVLWAVLLSCGTLNDLIWSDAGDAGVMRGKSGLICVICCYLWLCTFEFETRRASYYWLLVALSLYQPYVWEYSRLNVTNTVMSKRKLNRLVKEKRVDGWDDPRLMTLSGLRRRGVTSTSINAFVQGIGITRRYSNMYSFIMPASCLNTMYMFIGFN